MAGLARLAAGLAHRYLPGSEHLGRWRDISYSQLCIEDPSARLGVRAHQRHVPAYISPKPVYSREDLVSGSRELALVEAGRLFERFGWNAVMTALQSITASQ